MTQTAAPYWKIQRQNQADSIYSVKLIDEQGQLVLRYDQRGNRDDAEQEIARIQSVLGTSLPGHSRYVGRSYVLL